MKKASMLIALFIVITATGNAQTTKHKTPAEKSGPSIQQTLASAAPHIPLLTKYDGSGRIWHGEKYNYTMESQDRIKKWAKEYPQEKTKFFESASAYLKTTNVSKLPGDEAEKYYDVKAKWMMIAQM